MRDGALDFDAMQTRLHPAESRIRKLSAEIPAEYVVFDVLVWDGEPVWELPLAERRERVERARGLPALAGDARARRRARAGSTASRRSGSTAWSRSALDLPYLPGSREAVVKVKEHQHGRLRRRRPPLEGRPRARSRRCCSASTPRTASLDYVGSCAVAAGKRAEVAERVLPLLEEAPERRFSEPNRWGGGELEEAAVRPELVVEVRYDKVQGNRFRHGTKLLRWRDDKDPQRLHLARAAARRATRTTTVEALFAPKQR